MTAYTARTFLQAMVDSGGKCDIARDTARLPPRKHSFDCGDCMIKGHLLSRGINSCPMVEASNIARELIEEQDQDKDNII
jgi:hypothetical protein